MRVKKEKNVAPVANKDRLKVGRLGLPDPQNHHHQVNLVERRPEAGLAIKNPPKKPKKPEKPTGLVFFRKPGFFPTLA